MIRFFSTTFRPTIKPVFISLAKYTLPNLPSPSFLMNLKLYFPIPIFSFVWPFCFKGVFDWFLKKEGKVFYDLWVARASLELDVEEVSFKAFGFPPDLRIMKNPGFISGVFEFWLTPLFV